MSHNPGTDAFALSVLYDDFFVKLYFAKTRPPREMGHIRKRQAVMQLKLDYFPEAEQSKFDEAVNAFPPAVGALDGFPFVSRLPKHTIAGVYGQ
jgi:hypothetical protein